MQCICICFIWFSTPNRHKRLWVSLRYKGKVQTTALGEKRKEPKRKKRQKGKKDKPEKKDKDNKSKKPSTPAKNSKNIQKIKNLLKTGNFSKAANLIIDLLKTDPDNPELIKLKNESCLKAGNDYLKKGNCIKAEEMYSHVDINYGNIKTVKLKLKRQKKKQAQISYISGIKHFINDQFELAIKKWELALKLNPDHIEATANIKRAKALLEKLKTL